MPLLTLTINGPTDPPLLQRLRALSGPERQGTHAVMAAAMEDLTRGYLLAAPSVKGTAQKLGATPSGFYKRAAQTVEGRASSGGASIIMQRAGLSRAFRPYDLRPIRGRLLTIPVDAEAYGRRAREFSGAQWRRFSEEDVAAGKSTHAGLVFGRPAPEKGGLFHALFRGVKKVSQPQDRNLLPSDQDYLDTVTLAALEALAGK
jgi:hypothetical protein